MRPGPHRLLVPCACPDSTLQCALAAAAPCLPGLASLSSLNLPTQPPARPPQVSPAGEVLQTLMDPDGSVVSHVSAVTEHGGRLFLGNLAKDYVSVLQL